MYKENVGIPMETKYCASLVADLFLFCYDRDFMMISSLILFTLKMLHPEIWMIF